MKSFLAFLIALLASNLALSAELFGSVDAINGSASVSDLLGKSVAVSSGQKIYEGQIIKTAADGEVHIVTEDGGLIALRPNTEFRVDKYKAEGGSDDHILMSLLKGSLRSITGWIGKHNTSAYSVATPGTTIGIRGTDHETTVILKPGADGVGTYDTVIEGGTTLKTAHGSTDVTPGKFAFAPQDKPVAPVVLEKNPEYWSERSLKIEERIKPRKEFLRGHMERMREERIREISSGHKQPAEPHREHKRERERR